MEQTTLKTKKGIITITQEKITYEQYYEFLTRSDLGKQYPAERFKKRVNSLLQNVQISLTARNEEKEIIGICFGLTDYSYWLFITDLGIDRNYEKNGIGSELIRLAREAAGGTKDIIVVVYANTKAVPFYEKTGMIQSRHVMEQTDVEWTPFTVS